MVGAGSLAAEVNGRQERADELEADIGRIASSRSCKDPQSEEAAG